MIKEFRDTIKRKKYNKLLKQYEKEENKNKRRYLKKIIYKKYSTNVKCFRCGKNLLISDLKDYDYLCLNCNENMYSFEARRENL